MRNITKCSTIFLFLVSFLVSGCVYSNIQRPLTTEFNKTELGTKKGEASAYSVLWLVAWGDAGTKAAAENAGIKVIRYADIKQFSILLGLYFKGTAVVYGD